MNGHTLRGAAHVLGVMAGHDGVRDAAGATAAGFTTWGFGGFAVLAIAALVGRRDAVRRAGVTGAVGCVSAVVAGWLGLLIKVLVAEPRPCQVDPPLAEATTCPPPGDWSFPSNHAVFAGVFAVTVVVIALSTARLWIASAAVTLALLVAVSRVVLGVHHWWDVLAGLVIGATLAAVTLTLVAPRVDARLDARGRPSRRPSPVR